MADLNIKKGEAKKEVTYTVTATFIFTESDLTDPNPLTIKKKDLFKMMSNEEVNPTPYPAQ